MLFLDEIGELGLDEQAMILRAIEDKRFLPVGSDREVESDFQLIAGTNRDLGEAVAQGRFRDDLYLNTRIAKFAPDGRFLFEWGKPGKGEGQLDLPRALAVDRDGLVYVADRENDRVQVFDARGRYLRQWKSPAMGRPYALTLLPGGQLPALLQMSCGSDSRPPEARLDLVADDGSV